MESLRLNTGTQLIQKAFIGATVLICLQACNLSTGTLGPAPGVAAVNHAPVAIDASFEVAINSHVTVELPANDADAADTLTYAIITSPAHGALSGTAPQLTYTPTSGYSGSDSFTFKANDGKLDSNTATISITASTAPAQNHAPVATAQSVNVSYNTATTITLAGTDADGDLLTYTVNPGGDATHTAHGSLSGTAPNLTYTPTGGYYGSDSFTFKVNDGTVNSATATISVTVLQPIIYLRSSNDSPAGSDGTGTANDPTHPFLTAQAAVNAAFAQNPAVNKPVIIDVGSVNAGNFGDITLTQNFGQFVTWRGVDSTHSVIGNLIADGAAGTSAVDDGMGTPASGQNGANGYNVTLSADANITFGNISSNGGNGGDDVNSDGVVISGNGGNGGVIAIGANTIVGAIVANGGIDGIDSYTAFGGQGSNAGTTGNGGTVTVAAGAIAGNITALGASTNSTADSSKGGAGGTVTISGRCGTIAVNGGNDDGEDFNNQGDYATPGNGGSVVINAGGISSNIYANGGSDPAPYIGTGASGGVITINGTSGDVYAIGGDGGSGGNGGTINVGGNAANVTATGGNGAIGDFEGGNGGSVSVTGSVLTVTADAGAGDNNSGNSGTGGTITIAASGSSGDISARGGAVLGGNGTDGGTGGTVNVWGISGAVSVDGGSAGTGGCVGGNGGGITIHSGAVSSDLSSNGANGTLASGGNGGTIVYSLTATTTATKTVTGGLGDIGNGQPDGNPGTISTIP